MTHCDDEDILELFNTTMQPSDDDASDGWLMIENIEEIMTFRCYRSDPMAVTNFQ